MNEGRSLDRGYFESLYAGNADPWSFATSDYEAEKYRRSIGSLRSHYVRALEIGCSIGVFTHLLAPLCDELIAIDISERALESARARCADRPQVRFAHAIVPRDFPPGPFDLITCCEVGYYWSDDDLAAARDRIAGALAPGGDLLLVHWLPKVADYVRDGDAVHAHFLGDERFRRASAYRAESYRLDVLTRR